MKKLQFTLFLGIVVLFMGLPSINAQNLNQIESKIHQAYATAWAGDASSLEKLVDDLSKQTTTNQAKTYWEAYANYRLAIFYSAYDKTAKSKAKTNRAIELLEEIKKKNSEDYALLSCLMGFSIQFSPMTAAFKGPKAGRYAQKSIHLNDNNLRGHYSVAMNDFYTPKMFGGGDVTEEHLKKSLNLKHKSEKEAHAPTWGKNEVYELLVRFYIREEKTDEAKMYCKMGLGQYPQDARLQQHAKSLGLNQ
ncbi:MAG: hypothetical protein ACPGJS_07980 [Flammeovirgaceae bacterium]